MALTLVKEDGSGMVDANSYASVADGDAFHEAHLYAQAWSSASVANKQKALVFATRVIDAEFQFYGWRMSDDQGLEWPREGTWLSYGGGNDAGRIPKAVVEATCEMARELLIADRTAAPVGEGVESSSDGTTLVKYCKSDTRPVVSHLAQAMLAPFGVVCSARGGAVRLDRV